MLLPVGATLRALTRTIELRTLAEWPIAFGAILARARKPRALLTATVFPRFVETGLVEARSVEIPGAFTRRAGVAAGVVGRRGIALLPRF